MFKRLFTIALILLALNAGGQNKDINFYPVSKGLSQHSITSVLQDSKGFLWIGTRHGLNRYDGISYLTYEHVNGDSSTISNSTVQCLTEDKKGNIWIGTYGGGLNYYNYSEDKFEIYKNDKANPYSLSDDFVTAVWEDYDGNIWVGTEKGGLNLLNKENGTFSRYISNDADPFSITSNNVTSINEDRNGNLWVGTYGGGINLFDRNKMSFIPFKKGTAEGLESNVIRTIYRTSNGALLVGTHQGVKKLVYNDGRYIFTNILTNHPLTEALSKVRVLSLSEDQEQRLWIGTENEGLFMVDPMRGTGRHFLHTPDSDYGVNSNSIWSLFTGKYGTVWIGTYNQGLFKIDPYEEKFGGLFQSGIPAHTLSHNVISSFAEDNQGNLWVATDGGGLNYFNRKTGRFTRYKSIPQDSTSLSSDAVVSILIDNDNNLWAGTWEGGISILPEGAEAFQHLIHDPLNKNTPSGNDIYKLYQDSKGNIWIGAFRDGLDVYNSQKKQIHHINGENSNGIIGKKIRAILEDHQGYMWIGTEGAGLNRIRINDNMAVIENTWYSSNHYQKTGLYNNTITYLFEDSDSILWVGTEGGGVYYYDRTKDHFLPIDDDQRLRNNVIYGMLEDNRKVLWISTNNGLAAYDKKNRTTKIYNASDGLQSSEFFKSACLKTTDGYLLFGGINGFNMFNPERVKKNPNPPPVYITSFLLSNEVVRSGPGSLLQKNILDTKKIQLKYNQNDFSFEFAALNFSQSNRNEYTYKLENYDDEWQKAGSRSEAYYTNVPPGRYVFRVKGSNNDGIWNEQDASILIDISKPWYSTYWAYGGYSLIILSILFWSMRTIIYKERLQAQLQLEHMELTKMQELDQLKSRFFANISHEFRTPLTLIISPLKTLYLDETKNDYKKQIKMMIRNAERLLGLINQILDLAKLESGSMKLKASRQDLVKFLKPHVFSFSSYADRQFITYKTNLPKEPVYVYFEQDKLEKVFTNLLSNAIKYTPEFGEVSVTMEQKGDTVEIVIADSGIGIPEDQISYIFNRFYRAHSQSGSKGTGIGLALTKELVELHKGKIEVSSVEGKGTKFTVRFPLGSHHLDKSEISEDRIVHQAHTDNYPHKELMQDNISEINSNQENDKTENNLPLVLIAEDNEDMLSFISSYLQINYRTLECRNGKEALELSLEQIPDIIISDIMMPEIDGYELCTLLKNDEKTSHIPVILLTAKASNESIEQGFELGANYYVTKPFNPKLLELRIKNILKSRKMFKEQVLNNKTINLEPKHVIISSADENFIKKAVEFVEKNMDNSELQVEDLCKHLGMSKIQLYRKMKGLIDQSANEFIRTIRLKRAAQLLKQHHLTIAEITYQVGFNDLPYFRQCFKKQYGVNPSEFAQQGSEE